MGIRPCKVAGFGVTNIQISPEGHILDTRVNWERLQSEDIGETSTEEFLTWVIEHQAEIEALAMATGDGVHTRSPRWDVERMLSRLKDIPSPTQCIHYHHEGGGLRNVLIFTPPEMAYDWNRYNNTLDWIEELHRYGNKKSWVLHIKDSGIYPYNGFLIRYKKPKKSFLADTTQIPTGGVTGHIYDELGPVMLSTNCYWQLTGTGDIPQKPLTKGTLLRHLKRDFRPPVPITILALILWSGCFKDPVAFVNELRPLLYLYWS